MFGEKANRIKALESQLELSERTRRSIESDMKQIRNALGVSSESVLETIQLLKDRKDRADLLGAAAKVIKEVEKHYSKLKKTKK